jgi:hypothetical protein
MVRLVEAAGGQPPHHDGGRLGADVAAHAHDDRDKGGQVGQPAEAFFEMADDQ